MPELPIKNRSNLEVNYVKARGEMPPGGWREFMLGSLSPETIEVLVRNSIPMRDFIDVEQLVNRHVLRQDGIEPGSVRVVMGNLGSSFIVPEWHLLVVDGTDLRESTENSEFLYVMMAHELTHFRQQLGQVRSSQEFKASVRRYRLHANRPHEQEAFFWEAQQATKFGWGREDYERYLRVIYPEKARKLEPSFVLEHHARARAAMPVMTRRPVRVRPYRRRH